jgi:hypothetical protein
MGSSRDSGRTFYLNVKTASSLPSVLGVPPVVDPAMAWLSMVIFITVFIKINIV